jgi:hypothetical protein
MHCLYCDRPLALLKRLTGDGEFCSKEHRKIYQREHSQLALARLLEAQPNAGAKARPARAPASQPLPELQQKEQKPVVPENQPEMAGFLTDEIKARAQSEVSQPASLPRFTIGRPVWNETTSPQYGNPHGPGPKTARFLAAETPQPRSFEGAARRQERYSFKSPVSDLRFDDGPRAATALAKARLQPAEAGFLHSQPAASDAPRRVRRVASPQFGSVPRPLPEAKAVFAASAANPNMRPANFISGAPIERKEPGEIRRPAATPRWKPLEPALPEQEPGNITLVLGAFLERPVRPASQDHGTEALEILFQPVSFPPYSPRMGCLEERLHRTDRIGFSPP